jgi:hypothetical protein
MEEVPEDRRESIERQRAANCKRELSGIAR